MSAQLDRNWQRAAAAITSGVLSLLLGACVSSPPPAHWAVQLQASSQRAVQAFLQGQSRVAEVEWAKAWEQASSTGDAAVMARVALLECAMHMAALAGDASCPRYQAMAAGAQPAEQAYARYLQAQHTQADIALLPAAQQAVAAQLLQGSVAALPVGVQPLAALTAAGVALQAQRLAPEAVQQAVQITAQQGWRRAGMAWVHTAEQAAVAAGDRATADAMRLRLQVLERTRP